MSLDAPNYQHADNVPRTAGDRGNEVLAVRKDVASTLATVDGNYGPLQLDNSGNLRVQAVPEGAVRATYSAAAFNVTPAALATHLFTISGNASNTVKVRRIAVTGIQTAAGIVLLRLLKLSTALTGGTSSTPTVTPHDSLSGAGQSVVRAYTANPTGGGILVGDLRSQRVIVPAVASLISADSVALWDFGGPNGQCPTLRGVTQGVAVHLNGVTLTGGSLSFWVEWTEEV
ncbi:MAG: hypothetical protein ACREMY_02900 [bacterium]